MAAPGESSHQLIPPPHQRALIDRQVLEIAHRILHDRIRKAPPQRHLRRHHRLLKGLPLRLRHQRRNRQIAKPLSRC